MTGTAATQRETWEEQALGVVDLRSDTVTRPTQGMRDAMAGAEVGDDVFGEDPTVNALQERAAALFCKEAGLFVPTGTMANLLAVLAQTRPGDSVILHEDAHPFQHESGNLAMVAGVMPRTAPGACGILAPESVEQRVVVTEDPHYSPTTLISIENTANRGGGAVYPLDTIAAIAAVARKHGLRLHCDGARIFNAVVATGLSPAEYAAHVDTLCFCLSKGLGCPAGSVLVGDSATIARANRFRKMLGGGMRQVGILAAAGLYALDHHVDRLQEDHGRAKRFRDALEDAPGLAFPLPSPTNMIYVEVNDAEGVAARLAKRGVLVLAEDARTLRAVFHLDVTDEDVEKAIGTFQGVCSSG